MKIRTKAIHEHQEPEQQTGAVTYPIYMTSTYGQTVDGHKGYDYSRTVNPTRTVLEKVIATLENGKYGLAFSSGMGAIDAILHLLKSGDEVLLCDDVYGGTYRICQNVFSQLGLKFSFIDFTRIENIERALTEKTKMLWVESPTNPLLKVIDIQKVAEVAKKHGLITVVDNTFASPYLQNPLDLNADIVVHSTTKYLGGHSDVIGGAIVVNNNEHYERLKFLQNAVGAVPSPFDCWLVLRGIKTLALRMEAHCENAQAIAEFLDKHPKVKKVYYPGLKTHPQHKIAKRQMRGFGGMVSFEHKGTLNDVKNFLSKLKLFILAESLGGVESLIEHPATMTHSSIPENERLKLGISSGLIRISVGIEDKEDLLEDLKNGLG